jgi:hypothetical protein
MLLKDQYSEVAEYLVARGWQRHCVCHTVCQWVGSGHHVEQECEVTGSARHRTDDGEVGVGR